MKTLSKFNVVARLALATTLAFVFQTTVQAQPSGYPPMPAYNENCLGINDGFSYTWDGGALATDAFKEARGPVLDDFTTVSETDNHKWPVGNQTVNFLMAEGPDHDLDELNPWVLLPYAQTGVWASGPQWGDWVIQGAEYVGEVKRAGLKGYEFNLGPDTNVLKIFAGNLPANPLNRWHLVPKKFARKYAQAMKTSQMKYIFRNDRYASDLSFPLLHPQVKEQMKPFCRIRYMLGDNVNSMEFSGRKADRTKSTHPTWNTPGGDGIPYEWEVWIANHLGVNVYHSDHVKSWDAWKEGDLYLTKQANYFAKKLRGNVIREYGNEIWNSAPGYYFQTVWVWDNGPYPDPNRANWDIMHHNYGQRMYDTGGVWRKAFRARGRRKDIDLTLALQIAWPDGMTKRFVRPDGSSLGNRIDSVGGTFYLGGPVQPGTDLFNSVASGGLTAVDARHREDMIKLQGNITRLMDLTRDYTKKWHLYEGGSHMNFIGYEAGNAQHQQVWNSVQSYWNSGTYTSTMNQFASWWRGIQGSGELIWFSLHGIDTPVSPFGIYTSTDDVTPIYSGVQSFIQNYNNL